MPVEHYRSRSDSNHLRSSSNDVGSSGSTMERELRLENEVLRNLLEQKEQEIAALTSEVSDLRRRIAGSAPRGPDCPSALVKHFLSLCREQGIRVSIPSEELPAVAAKVNSFKRAHGWTWPEYTQFVTDLVRSGLTVTSAHLTSDKVLAVIIRQRAEARRDEPSGLTPAPTPAYHQEWQPPTRRG